MEIPVCCGDLGEVAIGTCRFDVTGRLLYLFKVEQGEPGHGDADCLGLQQFAQSIHLDQIIDGELRHDVTSMG